MERPFNISDGQILDELNQALLLLADLFPSILPEVFREMLCIYKGETFVSIIVDQLLNHTEKWVRGRYKPLAEETLSSKRRIPSLPLDDQFRRGDYRRAARKALYKEFGSLSKGTVDAVTAEKNHSYTLARPILQAIVAKSWRYNFGKFFSKRRKLVEDKLETHGMIQWPNPLPMVGPIIPWLKTTENLELNQEMYQTLIAPLVQRSQEAQISADWRLAIEANEREARSAHAVYECECCFSDTTFEQMAACTFSAHIICFRCLCTAFSEALHGQSWERNVDYRSGKLKCLAPVPKDICPGCMPTDVTRRAVTQSQGGFEQWLKFESRFASQNLIKSRLRLIRCPFCPYAEVKELYLPPESLRFHLNTSNPFFCTILIITSLALFPILGAYTLLSFLYSNPTPSDMVFTSLTRLASMKYYPRRFQCRSPHCSLPSCISCSKLWLDPHLCHEAAASSLRTFVEAARTAAFMRTCPRCNLRFIKESGCNKLECICGYVMCYVCRQGIKGGPEGESYRHFCQHFRPFGGECSECGKCDLYRGQNEDDLIKQAGQEAEIEWRDKHGMGEVRGIEYEQPERVSIKRVEQKKGIQAWVDWGIGVAIRC